MAGGRVSRQINVKVVSWGVWLGVYCPPVRSKDHLIIVYYAMYICIYMYTHAVLIPRVCHSLQRQSFSHPLLLSSVS